MDCVVDDGESLCGRDLMKKLDDDTAMHVLSYLTSAVDLARASAVSLSWRGFVRDGKLWRRLCVNAFPEVEKFRSIEDGRSAGGVEASPTIFSYTDRLEMEHRIFRTLFRELQGPCIHKSCLKEALFASSTDNYPGESIKQTLYPRPKYNDVEQIPSYWSSEGQGCSDVPETLTYRLVSRLCVVHEVKIRPFKAYFQPGVPVYSARNVRIRLGGLRKESMNSGFDNGSMSSEANHLKETDFEWTYVSSEFPMEQADTLQSFKLETPVLCVGGILRVELLGRVQTQQIDNLYYICVCHVMVVGRPLVEFDYQSLPGFEDYVVKYSGDSRVSPGTSGKYLTGQTELGSTSSSWPSFAERIRQLRTSSLRQNRVLLDTLLGHFTVASFLLPNDGATSSEDDGDDEYHFPDGISQFTDELHTSEGDVPMSPSSDA